MAPRRTSKTGTMEKLVILWCGRTDRTNQINDCLLGAVDVCIHKEGSNQYIYCDIKTIAAALLGKNS